MQLSGLLGISEISQQRCQRAILTGPLQLCVLIGRAEVAEQLTQSAQLLTALKLGVLISRAETSDSLTDLPDARLISPEQLTGLSVRLSQSALCLTLQTFRQISSTSLSLLLVRRRSELTIASEDIFKAWHQLLVELTPRQLTRSVDHLIDVGIHVLIDVAPGELLSSLNEERACSIERGHAESALNPLSALI
mgnify:FL=1